MQSFAEPRINRELGDPASSAYLATETKFMQQYRIASPVDAGGDMVAVRNGSGQVEIFTIKGGAVWNIYPDTASPTGYSRVQTGLTADFIAAGLDAKSHLVVVGSSGSTLKYVIEAGVPGARWGQVQDAKLVDEYDPPDPPSKIHRLFAAQIAGALYIGGNTDTRVIYSVWDRNPGVFMGEGGISTWRGPTSVLSGNSADTVQISQIDRAIIQFWPNTNQVSWITGMEPPLETLCVDTALDSQSQNQYFAIGRQGDWVYQGPPLPLHPHKPSIGYRWKTITKTPMQLRDLRAVRDGTGAIHLFLVGNDSRIYHMTTEKGEWLTPSPIVQDATSMSVATNAEEDIELFVAQKDKSALVHMIRDAKSTNWKIGSVEVPDSGKIEEFISYSTEATVYDAAGAPMPMERVEVRTSAETILTINGATYFVDSLAPAIVETDAAGAISIIQETNALGVPTLQINLPRLSQPDKVTAIRQFDGVKGDMAKVTSDELLHAKDAEGSNLLPDQYHNSNDATALAAHIRDCMKLAGTTEVHLDTSGLIGHARKPGVGWCANGNAAVLNRLRLPNEPLHWQLDFSTGHPVYRKLTPEDARLVIEEQLRSGKALDAGSFLEEIGDFIAAVSEKVVSVTKLVIETVKDGINAVITFVLDKINYVFQAIVDTIEQAFDLVEAAFAQVQVAFRKVFEWLGFIFNWDDIKRTRTALVYTVNQFLGFAEGATLGVQKIIDDGFAAAQKKIDELFDRIIKELGQDSIGGYIKAKTPDDQNTEKCRSAMSNNFVLQATLQNLGSANPVRPEALRRAAEGGAFDVLFQRMKTLATTVENSKAFADAAECMKNLGGTPDQIFRQLLAAIIRLTQGVIKVALSGVQTVLDALLDLIALAVRSVKDILNEAWNIPFVSEFYRSITNSELTLLDLFCLIMAIPSTILFKLIKGAAPFPDETSVDAFKSSFTSRTLLARAGFAPKDEALVLRERKDAANTSVAGMLMGVVGTVSTWTFGIVSAVLDVKPNTGTGIPDPATKTLSTFALAAEIVAQAVSTPWITSSEKPGCDTREGAGQVLWIFEVLGLGVDIGFYIKERAFPENNETEWGVVIAEFYGACHLITFGAVFAQLGGWARAAKLLALVPELTKFLRLPKVEVETEGASLLVLGAIDFLGMASSGICSLVDVLSSEGLMEAQAIA